MEFIRLDLSLPSGGVGSPEAATRRQAAGDVLQALVSSGLDAETTQIVGTWISSGLQEYHANPVQNWKSKNSAVYLLTAIASRGSTSMVRRSFITCLPCVFMRILQQHGVTATNQLVDVISFFSEHVFQDLQAAPGSVHPILQVDAIRFLQTFRNQVRWPACACNVLSTDDISSRNRNCSQFYLCSSSMRDPIILSFIPMLRSPLSGYCS
jgi:exportin-2 (importin alpha re-exporter)